VLRYDASKSEYWVTRKAERRDSAVGTLVIFFSVQAGSLCAKSCCPISSSKAQVYVPREFNVT
jgi:hypothetical protein